jgi:hypothetical protein
MQALATHQRGRTYLFKDHVEIVVDPTAARAVPSPMLARAVPTLLVATLRFQVNWGAFGSAGANTDSAIDFARSQF